VNGFIWASAPAADPWVIHTVAPLAFQGYTPTSWMAADGPEPPGTQADVTAWVVCAALSRPRGEPFRERARQDSNLRPSVP
jgi:hypothetical protein